MPRFDSGYSGTGFSTAASTSLWKPTWRFARWRKKQEEAIDQTKADPHEAERQRFQQGLRRDRQQQTYASYSHVTNEMTHTRTNGAWEHVSCYESRV